MGAKRWCEIWSIAKGVLSKACAFNINTLEPVFEQLTEEEKSCVYFQHDNIQLDTAKKFNLAFTVCV
jgi:hypothetical protein